MSDDIFTVKVPDLIIISVSCFKHMTKSGKVTLQAFFFFLGEEVLLWGNIPEMSHDHALDFLIDECLR